MPLTTLIGWVNRVSWTLLTRQLGADIPQLCLAAMDWATAQCRLLCAHPQMGSLVLCLAEFADPQRIMVRLECLIGVDEAWLS